MSVGHCWPMAGSCGFAIIRLHAPVKVTNISLEHVSHLIALDYSTAPKGFELHVCLLIHESPVSTCCFSGVLHSFMLTTSSQGLSDQQAHAIAQSANPPASEVKGDLLVSGEYVAKSWQLQTFVVPAAVGLQSGHYVLQSRSDLTCTSHVIWRIRGGGCRNNGCIITSCSSY